MLQKSIIYGAQPLELNIYGELGNKLKWTPENIKYWLKKAMLILFVKILFYEPNCEALHWKL